MGVDAYKEAIRNAEKNNKLNNNIEQLDRVTKISYKLIDEAPYFARMQKNGNGKLM